MSSDSTTGWEVRYSKSRSRAYFYNANDGTSVWDRPAHLSDEQILALPGANYLSDPPPPEGKVRASHLLIKHRDSRRPSSWKEEKITRTKEEATEILEGHRKELDGLEGDKLKDKFKEIAKVHSDCASARDGGDLGWFGKGQMQKPFEEATFAIPVDTLSEIISTDSGVHIILRSG